MVRRKEDLVCLQRPAHRLFVKGHRVQPGIHAGQVTESLCLIGHLDGSAVEDIQKVFAHQIFLIEARRRRDLGYHLLFIVQLFHTSSVPFIKKGRQTLHPTPIILKTAVFCWLSAAMPGRASIVAGTYRPRRGPTFSPRCGRDVRWDILCRGNYPAHAQYSFACRRTEPSGSLTVYTKPDGLSTKTFQLCCGWSRNTISPVALSIDSTMARLSSWMPLLRMRSPPC